jgi:hypothetical protein
MTWGSEGYITFTLGHVQTKSLLLNYVRCQMKGTFINLGNDMLLLTSCCWIPKITSQMNPPPVLVVDLARLSPREVIVDYIILMMQ